MKNRITRLTSLLIAAAMLVGCGTSGGTTTTDSNAEKSDTATASGDTNATTEVATPAQQSGVNSLHYAFWDEPPGIDPGVSQGSNQSTLYQALYSGLVSLDENRDVVPGVAESWDMSEDGLVYTFHLREGLKWSDGQPLTAQDFVYSWVRVLNPDTASTYSWFVEMFLANSTEYIEGKVGPEEVGVSAPDDKTVVVKLKMPASYFLQALVQGCWMPVRKDMVEKAGEKWPFSAETHISNGPFQFVEYQIGSHVSMKKNPNYWNADAIKLDEIKFSIIEDKNTLLAGFEAGKLDGIAAVPPEQLVQLMASDERLYTYDKLSFQFLRLNTTTKGLDDVRVRRAINLAFDRKGFLEGSGSLLSQPAMGAVPSGIVLNGKNFRDAAGDHGLQATAQLDEARKLLTEAGYPDGKGIPKLRLHCSESQVKSAEILQQMLLENLGIQSEILLVDSKMVFPMIVEGQYDIAFSGWGGDYIHPMTFLELFTSKAYDNCTRWSNAEFDKLIEEARVEQDEAKQLELLVKAEDILMQESPVVAMSFPTDAIMMQPYVKGWVIDPMGVLYLTGVSIEK